MECGLCQNKICLKGVECDKFYGVNSKKENIKHYLESDSDSRILNVSSKISKNISRLEEVSSYIDLMKIKVIGIGFCKGLQKEGKILHEYLTNRGVECHSVICGHAGIDNEELNLRKKNKDLFEVSCNPYGQATIMNNLKTELNIALGFCIGHDILFSKYSQAPVTTLVVKDRVNKHCPGKALEIR